MGASKKVQDERRLSTLYESGHGIMKDLAAAKSVREAMDARDHEISWRDEMLPVVERVFGQPVRSRLYFLGTLSLADMALSLGIPHLDEKHRLTLLCHGARLHRLGELLDKLNPSNGARAQPVLAGAATHRGRKKSQLRVAADEALSRLYPDQDTWTTLKVEAVRAELERELGQPIGDSMVRRCLGRRL